MEKIIGYVSLLTDTLILKKSVATGPYKIGVSSIGFAINTPSPKKVINYNHKISFDIIKLSLRQRINYTNKKRFM